MKYMGAYFFPVRVLQGLIYWLTRQTAPTDKFFVSLMSPRVRVSWFNYIFGGDDWAEGWLLCFINKHEIWLDGSIRGEQDEGSCSQARDLTRVSETSDANQIRENLAS